MMAEIEPPASTKPTTTAYNRLRTWDGITLVKVSDIPLQPKCRRIAPEKNRTTGLNTLMGCSYRN